MARASIAIFGSVPRAAARHAALLTLDHSPDADPVTSVKSTDEVHW